MSTAHSNAAKEFLKNQTYAKWHDATFWSVRTKRDKMAYGLEEWEQLREKASQIKRHTITHLDEYLDQFATNAEKNGCIVHWAKDAAEFNEIVYGILKQHNVKKMVKSKSMLTEECEMNPYLEAHGIEVVETDLGERIIQLKGQKPSHIVMPAIHLNHDDVGELFEEKGISTEKGNHDPTYLTYRARLSLRNEFLTADAGMTGGNFGIAATGDIVVCTNCTSQPSASRRLFRTTTVWPSSNACSAVQAQASLRPPTPPTSARLVRRQLRCISSLWTMAVQNGSAILSIGRR